MADDKEWQQLTHSMPKTKEERDLLVKKFRQHDMDPALAEVVVEQLSETQKEDGSNIIFLFSEGDYVVTAIHVPHEAINSTGPVLMSGINEKSIIAAFSRDFIREKLDVVAESEEAGAGLPERIWIRELENLAEMIKFEMVTNPPRDWDHLLDNEGDR